VDESKYRLAYEYLVEYYRGLARYNRPAVIEAYHKLCDHYGYDPEELRKPIDFHSYLIGLNDRSARVTKKHAYKLHKILSHWKFKEFVAKKRDKFRVCNGNACITWTYMGTRIDGYGRY